MGDEREGRRIDALTFCEAKRGMTKEWVRWNRPLDGVLHRGVTGERIMHRGECGLPRLRLAMTGGGLPRVL